MAERTQTKKRTRLSREVREDMIFKAAREAFITSGYENTSMADIATKVGIVEGTIYRYVESKEELLNLVLENWIEQMVAECRSLLSKVSGASNRLRFFISFNFSKMLTDREICNLFSANAVPAKNYKRLRSYELNKEYAEMIIGIIGEGIEEGEFREDAPKNMIRNLVLGGSLYYAGDFLSGRSNWLDVERGTKQVFDIVHHALIGNVADENTGRCFKEVDNVVDRLEKVIDKLDK
jgi:AcrR family transcriptional regulator